MNSRQKIFLFLLILSFVDVIAIIFFPLFTYVYGNPDNIIEVKILDPFFKDTMGTFSWYNYGEPPYFLLLGLVVASIYPFRFASESLKSYDFQLIGIFSQLFFPLFSLHIILAPYFLSYGFDFTDFTSRVLRGGTVELGPSFFLLNISSLLRLVLELRLAQSKNYKEQVAEVSILFPVLVLIYFSLIWWRYNSYYRIFGLELENTARIYVILNLFLFLISCLSGAYTSVIDIRITSQNHINRIIQIFVVYWLAYLVPKSFYYYGWEDSKLVAHVPIRFNLVILNFLGWIIFYYLGIGVWRIYLKINNKPINQIEETKDLYPES